MKNDYIRPVKEQAIDYIYKGHEMRIIPQRHRVENDIRYPLPSGRMTKSRAEAMAYIRRLGGEVVE